MPQQNFNVLTVHTPKGIIEVSQTGDPDYPGVIINVDGRDVSRIEYNKDTDTIRHYTWDDIN